MRALTVVSDMVIPLTFAIILLVGLSRKVPVYDSFVLGAKEGFGTVLNILPTIIGLLVAVGMLRASGAIDLLVSLITPITGRLGYPADALPLTLMRLVSNSAATGLMLDIFDRYGPDSSLGRFVSIMMSCTETVFYTMSVYFMSVRITKTRHTLTGALLANLSGVIVSLWLTRRIWGP